MKIIKEENLIYLIHKSDESDNKDIDVYGIKHFFTSLDEINNRQTQWAITLPHEFNPHKKAEDYIKTDKYKEDKMMYLKGTPLCEELGLRFDDESIIEN